MKKSVLKNINEDLRRENAKLKSEVENVTERYEEVTGYANNLHNSRIRDIEYRDKIINGLCDTLDAKNAEFKYIKNSIQLLSMQIERGDAAAFKDAEYIKELEHALESKNAYIKLDRLSTTNKDLIQEVEAAMSLLEQNSTVSEMVNRNTEELEGKIVFRDKLLKIFNVVVED